MHRKLEAWVAAHTLLGTVGGARCLECCAWAGSKMSAQHTGGVEGSSIPSGLATQLQNLYPLPAEQIRCEGSKSYHGSELKFEYIAPPYFQGQFELPLPSTSE